MIYFDSHCHLNDPSMMEHIEEEIAALREAGVKALLCIGYDII